MLSACHPGPVLNFGSHDPSVGGTLAGMVTATASSISVVNRRVTVTELQTATKYETTIAANGGYTIQVPEGTYHIEIALEPGELYGKRPSDSHINNGDLDPHRDFVITGSRQTGNR